MLSSYVFFQSTILLGLLLSLISSFSIYLYKRKILIALLPIFIFPVLFILSAFLSEITEVFYPSRINFGGILFISFPLLYGLYVYYNGKDYYLSTFTILSLLSLGFFYFAAMYHPYGREETTENHNINKHIEIDRIQCMSKIEEWLEVNNIERYGYETDNKYLFEIRRNFNNLSISILDSDFNKYIFDEECNFIK